LTRVAGCDSIARPPQRAGFSTSPVIQRLLQTGDYERLGHARIRPRHNAKAPTAPCLRTTPRGDAGGVARQPDAAEALRRARPALSTDHARAKHEAIVTPAIRFTLVRHPEKFAAARAKRGTEVERAPRDLQPERLALQRQRVDFGGSLSDAEYRIRVVALERATRRMMPARAQLKPPSR
jgi:hypothetical protein